VGMIATHTLYKKRREKGKLLPAVHTEEYIRWYLLEYVPTQREP